MEVNAKAIAHLMMKFKYPKFKKTDPKFKEAMNEEIKKGTLLKEYMESKVEVIRKKLQRVVSIVYDFCQKFKKEEYYMIVKVWTVEHGETDYIKHFFLKGNAIQLMETYYILDYWIDEYAGVTYSSPRDFEEQLNKMSYDKSKLNERTITYNLYNDLKRVYTNNNISKLHDFDEKAGRIKKRMKSINVSRDNLTKLLELYFKHMKVDFKVLD